MISLFFLKGPLQGMDSISSDEDDTNFIDCNYYDVTEFNKANFIFWFLLQQKFLCFSYEYTFASATLR